jgi:hypothetical protein
MKGTVGGEVTALHEEAGIKESIDGFRFVSCGTEEDGEEE